MIGITAIIGRGGFNSMGPRRASSSPIFVVMTMYQ